MTKALTATFVVSIGAGVVSAFAYTVTVIGSAATPTTGSSTSGIGGASQAAGQAQKAPAPTASKTAPAEPKPKNLIITPDPLNVTGLAPGRSTARTLMVGNSNNQDVVLQSITATVLNPSPAPINGLSCTSPADFEVLVTNPGTHTIKKNDSRPVPITIRMNNSATRNQDGCMGKSFSFTFTATATSK